MIFWGIVKYWIFWKTMEMLDFFGNHGNWGIFGDWWGQAAMSV